MTPDQISSVLRNAVFGKGYPCVNYVYDADGNEIYIGIAPRGSATSDPSWKVLFLTYVDTSTGKQVETVRSSPDNSVFDNYATLIYA